MPRIGRLHIPGGCYHVMGRGLERRCIFAASADKQNFIDRLEAGLAETGTQCLAWAMMRNHYHLLLRAGITPLADLMRKLLSGYATTYNRRHNRVGYVFQNRYNWTGHAVLMGNRLLDWQQTGTVLAHFGQQVIPARRGYRQFIAQGLSKATGVDYGGGGLIREGWELENLIIAVCAFFRVDPARVSEKARRMYPCPVNAAGNTVMNKGLN